MATNMIRMMMLVNLKAYSTTPQLLSTTSHHYSPLPMFIRKSRYCPSNKRQIIACSSSKVPRFGITNAMASKEIMLLSTAQQPYTTTPFRSTTADHQSFDPSCDHLLVAVENSIKHAAHMVDTALLEYLENLEEKLSKENVFSPLFCIIKQLFTNMDEVVVLSELLLLAEKSSITLSLRKMQIIQLCNKRIENMQADQCWEEFPETLKEIFKAFMELILVDNNLRASLTDASTDKLIEGPNALTQILWIHMDRILKNIFHRPNEKPQKPTSPDFQKGPHGERNFTFYYGSNNEEWIKEFEDKARKVIKDQEVDRKVRIRLCRIRTLDKKGEEARVLSNLIEHDDLQSYFECGSDGRFVLTYNQKEVLLNKVGREIPKVLEDFHMQWIKDPDNNKMRDDGFEVSFISFF
ncbi:hypothetical protein F2P56_027062 [Juglans regia]|uniref:Uncharacterized protein LOC118343948 isoform X2 n=2 Tax=Juglans regia TaxID=51240 RepID=A0A6P9DVA9_JUGRE|nr:uncharacterized protein LOC118343948 isoform X2 [Juglans regia]KAF5452022.1 hypothetical protein F2P56_027062 [Juglans regia]